MNSEFKIDESIFKKIAEDDMKAFAEFYRFTERSVYAFALSILRNHDDALDVVQETYLKIRSAAHLYIPMGKPMAWVFTITKNLAISHIRQQNKTEHMLLEEINSDLSFSYIANSDDKLLLKAALSVLDEQEREIILLHAVSGFKHREIAKDLDLPIATVLSKYKRSLDKMRKHLLKQEGIR